MFRQIIICAKWIQFLFWLYRNYTYIQSEVLYSIQLKEQLENLGCLGIKLGQYLCNRPDIITPPMKIGLSSLLNKNKIHPLSYTKEILKKANMEHVILGDIIGSGSLAQVYRCTYNDDSNLVIKVNHPEVYQLPDEISALKNIIYMLRCLPRFSFLINMEWDDFFQSIKDQIDMTKESIYLKEFYTIYKDVDEIQIPNVIVGDKDFIIMTYCEGETLDKFSRDDPIYIKAHNLFVCSMLYSGLEHKLLHGDIHEGNILVKKDGTISIIDYGLCIRISMEQLIGILAISKFELNPSYENCENMVYALIHNRTITDDDILFPELTRELHNKYKDINCKEILLKDMFDIIMDTAHKYKVIVRGNIMAYFMNTILLESLSPYKEKEEITNLIAMTYMKRHPYFLKNSNGYIEEYYNNAYAKANPLLIEKYNLKVIQ